MSAHTWNTIQANFLGGEVSPRFLAQTQAALAQFSVAEARNAFVLPQGPITKRMGTIFVRDIGAFVNGRIHPFLAGDNSNVLAQFTAESVTVATTYTYLESFASPVGTPDQLALYEYTQLLRNSTFSSALTYWNSIGSISRAGYRYKATASQVNNTAVLWWDKWYKYNPTSIPDIPISQTTSILRPSDAFMVAVRAKYDKKALTGREAVAVDIQLEIVHGGSVIFDRTYRVASKDFATVSFTFNTPSAITGAVTVRATAKIANWTAPSYKTTEWIQCDIDYIALYAQAQNPPKEITLDTPYLEAELEDLHFIQSPFGNKELLVLSPKHAPQALYVDPADGLWKFGDYPFTDTAPEWAGNNWPSLATSFQGRLVLTGAPSTPETIFTSKAGDWAKFLPDDDTNIVASDPITFTPTQRGVNQWVAGHQRLLFGNAESEYAVFSQSGVIQPADVGVAMQTSYGALRNPQKMAVGESVIAVSASNTSLRFIQYNDSNGGYVSLDAFVQASHLGDRRVRRHFYTRDPHEILWCVMQDGTVCTLSFDQNAKFYAWTQMATDGEVVDGVSIVNTRTGLSTAVLLIKRIIEGESRLYIESINLVRDLTAWQYLDCSIRRVVNDSSGMIYGFDALNSKDVAVFVDDEYLGMQPVVDGAVDIGDMVGNVVDVGLPYAMSIRTLPTGTLTPDAGLASKKRYSELGVRGLFTRPPVINSQRPADRSPDSYMDSSEPPLLAEDFTVTTMEWDTFASVTVEEPLPFRATIAGIFGKLSSNSK